ncbi:uncharacterized protein LOC128260868 [Drosophila gunungcola]|uniref:Uncharacterized protein n=1 Tax=Drosophila gunungcola TaxID=103775 RepID=A0A9Q0BKG8_9MUSC|nr:uncharacterized protein LOC128260868 [Drosophila gunungcola]KAI8035196.1 hypothetical protein M5D96_012007 [Drosophila gunungcola]
MCMPYLTKLFGGANRTGGVTPLPSLANVTQVSADTVRTARSAKSGKSGKSGKSASRRNSNTNTNSNTNANANQSSESSLESNTEHPMIVRNTSASVDPIVTPADDETRTRRSWWGYLGMNRNKKPSIESL